MAKCNTIFKRLVDQISLSNSASAIHRHQVCLFAVIELLQLFFFNFSSDHSLIISSFIRRSIMVFDGSPLNK